MSPTAWVRSIPESFAQATCGLLTDEAPPIDVTLARVQHGAVVDGLRWLGFSIVQLPAAEELPDSVFVEDPAVLAGGRALICRSAHPVRGREAPSVRAGLRAAGLELVQMERGTLDGGDVLEVAGRLYVSPSARTDAMGIRSLARAFPDHEVIELPLPEGLLHLKCACSTPAPGTVLYAEGRLDPAAFTGLRVIPVPSEEWYAANSVGRGGRVLVAEGFPAARDALEAAGLTVRPMQLSEIRKADGSLTCLSLRLDPAAAG